MPHTQLPLLHAPSTSARRSNATSALRAARESVLRVPLVAKLLGANVLIALAALAAAAGGHPRLVGFVCIALALSYCLNTLLVRLALEPLDELERAAERVSRGEWYVRVPKSPIADRRIDRLGATVNRLLDTVSADHLRIHQLIQRSLAAREAERAALSGKLREDTAQQVCAVELQLGVAEQAFGAPAGLTALRTAHELASLALENVRRLADATYPGLLQELGLPAALAALAVRVRGRSGLLVSIDTSCAPVRMSPALVRTMYYVAEEAVRNAERHAAARSIEIRLSGSPDVLRLELADDGNGFDPAAAERDGSSVGLFQLREMLASAHGQLEILSVRGRGTRVIATARLDQGDTT